MADLDKLESGGGGGGGAVEIGDIRADDGGGAVEERERLTELEGISVLDFDLLCSTVALQTQGKWRKLESSEGEDATEDDYGGGVLRLWEGDVMDCFEDRHLCIESAWYWGFLFSYHSLIQKNILFYFLQKLEFWGFIYLDLC